MSAGGRWRGEAVLPEDAGRDALVAAVAAALASLPPGARVLLALSGGPDSGALAWLVRAARPDLDARALHVRHGLRDDAADAAAARAVAERLGLAWQEVAVDVAAGRDGPEAAARQARYAALADAAARERADAVLVGHTADDQAETVLLNLARGSGLAGAAGIPAVRPLEGTDGVLLLRPLLRLRRAAVRAVVAAEELAVVEDPMNAEVRYRRVRARRLLPRLAELSGGTGDPVGALTRFAAQARRDGAALDELAAVESARLVQRWGPVAVVERARLDALAPALAARLVRGMLADARGGTADLSLAEVDEVLALRAGGLELSRGVRVGAAARLLAVAPADVPALAERLAVLPGAVALAELGLRLHGDALPWRRAPDTPVVAPPGASGPGWAALPLPPGAKIVVRSRRPGDALVTRHGRRKLQDLLVDAGVPRLLRDLVPVVADERDEPLWVVGVALRRDPATPPGVRAWLAPG